MISKIKKPVSILLSLIMVFSVFAIVPLSASAVSSYFDLARGTLIQPEDILSFEKIGSFKFADYDDPTIIHEVKGSDFSYNKAILSVTDGYYSFGSTKLLPTSVSPGGLLIADYDSTTKMATFGVQNITHSFDETTGTLTIGGSGVVPDHYAMTGSNFYGVVFTQSNLVKHLIIDATDMIAIQQDAFMAHNGGCVLEDVKINSTSSTPLIIEEKAVFYRSGNTVTVTVNAVKLATVTNSPVKNYGSPVNLIYNVEQTITFNKNALTDPSRYLTVTFPTHCNIFIPGGPQFTDSWLQEEYDRSAEDGYEEDFWDMYPDLVEGTDYVLGDARYEELTPLNASLVVGNKNTALFSAYTITDESVNGTVTASVNGTNVTEAAADADVLLTVAPAEGYQFVSISAGDVSLTTVTEGSQYSFTMPKKPVTVTAEFEEAPAPTPAKLILHVGENGKVVMDNGTFGNATDASNIADISAPINVADGYKIFIVDDHTANLVEGGSINIATGGEVSFYPTADNTGKITAIPNEGYICTGWYNGDTLYSSDAALSYQSISEDITLTAKFAPKLFAGHTVTLGGDIGVNFYLNPAVLDTYTGTKTVKFTCDGEETTIDVPATPTADGYKVTRNVVAAQMAHTITATLYVDGEAVATDEFSVQEYAEKIYANPGEYLPEDKADKADEFKALAAAMLHYGAEAQTVFADALTEKPERADKNVAAANYSGVTADAVAAAINGETSHLNAVATQLGAKFYTSSLLYLSQNTLRLYFTQNDDSFDPALFDDVRSDYYYYVQKENIPAAELDDQQSFTVGNGTFTYSALDYVKAVIGSSMTDAQKNLAKALFLYNQAANAYFDDPVPPQNVVDLSTLEGDKELQNGDVVTGTLSGNKKITIAPGATVTLKNANITSLANTYNVDYAGITPLGDATILLEGENTVKGGNEDYPGIYAAQNATLTIGGTGSLVASSNGYGCGIGGGFYIGCGNIIINGGTVTATGGINSTGIGSGNSVSCGNITINGGTVTAIGGESAAGIGSGYDATCGNITINGGTVTAIGGEDAPGIGAGVEADCGNIMIADTVTQVTATKGGDESDSIGAGKFGTCGDVTIAPGANVTQN